MYVKTNVEDRVKERPFKNSIERAVYKASSLPSAPDDSAFDEEIYFIFRSN
jgi:colicin import membrane protein